MDEKIVELLGAETEEQVIRAFSGMSKAQIVRELDLMFPGEDNEELAESVADAVR